MTNQLDDTFVVRPAQNAPLTPPPPHSIHEQLLVQTIHNVLHNANLKAYKPARYPMPTPPTIKENPFLQLQIEWANIPQMKIINLVTSMNTRVCECVANGAVTL